MCIVYGQLSQQTYLTLKATNLKFESISNNNPPQDCPIHHILSNMVTICCIQICRSIYTVNCIRTGYTNVSNTHIPYSALYTLHVAITHLWWFPHTVMLVMYFPFQHLNTKKPYICVST